MTEQAVPSPRPRRRKRPSASTVVLGSLAAFLAILAFLAFQVRAGNDPALSAQTKVAQVQQQQPARRVIVRKVEDDYVITKVIPAPQATRSPQPALTTGSSGNGGGASTPAPVVTSGPAPAPVPAPSPAPAPVTRTS
jgi:hypothetical protein